MNNTICNMVKFFTGALMIFGLSGNAALAANNCGSDSNTFSSSIGATTSCANNNMVGCTIGAGDTGCTYGNSSCGFTVSVLAGGVSQSGDKSTRYELSNVTGSCRPRIAITEGNQGASYCSYFYPDGIEDGGDRLFTQSKNGKAVAHKQLDVCTDEDVQAPTLSPPVISLEKTVGREEADGSVDCSVDEISVIAGDPDGDNPTEVIYCYTVRNDGLGSIQNLEIVDDNGTPNDDSDDLYLACGDGSLEGGVSDYCEVQSAPVTIPNTVERVVNIATVEGTFNGEPCDTCTDEDTAAVNVAVVCDADTQIEADATGTVVERRGLNGTTRCGPKDVVVETTSVGLLCDGSCELKPECVAISGEPLPATCVQPCRPSNNWNTFGVGGTLIIGSPSPGNLPLCQEVLTNPANSDFPDDITNPSLLRSDGHSSAFRRNPLLYYFPASGGGNSVGTIYCILYPGENADAVCPAGSIVY